MTTRAPGENTESTQPAMDAPLLSQHLRQRAKQLGLTRGRLLCTAACARTRDCDGLFDL
jgi:hypothetical protein